MTLQNEVVITGRQVPAQFRYWSVSCAAGEPVCGHRFLVVRVMVVMKERI
jgi:hypothetical protein